MIPNGMANRSNPIPLGLEAEEVKAQVKVAVRIPVQVATANHRRARRLK